MSKVYSILSNPNVNCPGNFLESRKTFSIGMSKVYSILSNPNVNCPGNFLDITKDILNWRKIRAIFSYTASDKKTNNPSTAIEDK